MLSTELERLYPSGKTLVKDRVASRVHARDASVYAFSDEAARCAEQFMGWVDLASNPPLPFERIVSFAREARAEGFTDVVLIGQGGSTQAAMTITKYNKLDASGMRFRVLDSDSPVRLREVLHAVDPATTLVLIASKSGGTVEPRLMLSAVRAAFGEVLSSEQLVRRLVAITDPGSDLEAQAKAEGWRAVFSGEPSVGGRYSALSVFGLLPAALVGIDLEAMMARALEAERACSQDSIDNPAICLAAFLYDNYLNGRNKFSVLTQKRGRVLGLWIEQLVAESLGKGGHGILPNIEVDSLLLSSDPGDRCVVMYQTKNDSWDEMRNFEMSLSYVDPLIPRMNYRIESVEELAEHFVVWEYAVAFCGYLMQVCPFDQPDVAAAKAEVLSILRDGAPEPCLVESSLGGWQMGEVEARLAPCFAGAGTIREALRQLLGSIRPGDFFALNAFLPFTGEGRREALEVIRHGVAERFGVAACLEVGPRYLHSTGQLQKGGPNDGVFLIVSADELKDVPLEGEVAPSLGALAKAQAIGDQVILAQRGRRAVHLHVPDNSGVTLRALASEVMSVLAEVEGRAQA
ncbi:glucose-6-phosphate isomerase [Berryella wangjianweii]|uniref:Glucose-6-phosphate isomerase n=1 Tax=Berryella wangjianweii TaxID=2734634 RepID=A0A6M8J6B6_9ACTN|nr:glucose-6-phosphate isomerase [Berryella wangjianweii]QKF07456.1 glucose-6-phosphate isomerase [Berryella wangjianweii]